MVNRESYTHNQILADIAAIRGQIARLQQNAPLVNAVLTGSLTVDAGATINGDSLLTPQAFAGYPVVAQVDNTNFTVTQAVQTRATKQWSIPANDAQGGTVYRLSCWGIGTQGSTAQTLSFWLFAMGIQGAAVGYASSFVAANQAFGWNFVGHCQVTTPGSSGVAQYATNINARQSGASSSTPLNGSTDQQTINSTVSTNLSLSVAWGSTTGAPTMSCRGSMLERIGP